MSGSIVTFDYVLLISIFHPECYLHQYILQLSLNGDRILTIFGCDFIYVLWNDRNTLHVDAFVHPTDGVVIETCLYPDCLEEELFQYDIIRPSN